MDDVKLNLFRATLDDGEVVYVAARYMDNVSYVLRRHNEYRDIQAVERVRDGFYMERADD